MAIVGRFRENKENVREYVLATWPDGGRLSRLPQLEDDDGSHVEVCLGYFQGDKWVTTLDFHAFSSEVEERKPPQVECCGELMDLPGRRIGWFVSVTTPSSFLDGQKIDEETVSVLGLPRLLPPEWGVLGKEHPLEQEGLGRHRTMMREFRESPFEDDPEFMEVGPEENMEFLAEVHEVLFSTPPPPYADLDWSDAEESPDLGEAVFRFEVCGDRYVLVHALLRRNRPHLDDQVRTLVGKRGPMSFFVRVEETLRICGAGRSVAEAMRSVPFFVWPGEREDWERKTFEPGRLTFEGSEIWAMLGEFSAPWWGTAQFLAWAKDCPDLPVGVDPHRAGRW